MSPLVSSPAMSTMVGEPSPEQTMWRSATGPSAGVDGAGDAGGAAVGSAGSDPSPEHPASNDADSSAGSSRPAIGRMRTVWSLRGAGD